MINKKHLKLLTIAVFFLGLAVGAVAKTTHDQDFSSYQPLHLILVFSSGLSLGAIITRIRYERKIENLTGNQE